MFFGLGMIVGPSIGGLLFEYGGFACPFFVTGVASFIATLFAFMFLPKSEFSIPKSSLDSDLSYLYRTHTEEREKSIFTFFNNQIGCLCQHPDRFYKLH